MNIKHRHVRPVKIQCSSHPYRIVSICAGQSFTGIKVYVTTLSERSRVLSDSCIFQCILGYRCVFIFMNSEALYHFHSKPLLSVPVLFYQFLPSSTLPREEYGVML